MIAADRQAVAVAGDDPNVEIGIRKLEPVAIAGARP
jgi:hypothetical protein